jgi:hypothetical protein
MGLELPPVKEYFTIEAWEYESGDIGWRVKSNTDEEISSEILTKLSLELSEAFIQEDDTANPVIVSIFFQKKGTSLARWSKECEFHSRDTYVWLKKKLYDSEWRMRGHPLGTRGRRIWWSIGWLWHLLRGHFKPSQTRYASPARATAGPCAEVLSEASEKARGPSDQLTQGAAVVLQFKRPEDA